MVFHLDKERIGRCFRRSLRSYDEAAVVQYKLARLLLEALQNVPDTAFKRVLEIGCCTGSLSEMLCAKRRVCTLYLNDLVAEFEDVVLNRLQRHHEIQITPLFGDIESKVLPSDLSLVLSGATFQWLSDLPAFITQLGESLKPGSYLAFSIFGPGTLQEFSNLTSVSLHYHSDQDVLSLLEQDFIVESFSTFKDRLFFPSVREILRHIRATGVGGVSEYQWNKESLQVFKKRYIEEFGTKQGIPVSYAASCYVARRR